MNRVRRARVLSRLLWAVLACAPEAMGGVARAEVAQATTPPAASSAISAAPYLVEARALSAALKYREAADLLQSKITEVEARFGAESRETLEILDMWLRAVRLWGNVSDVRLVSESERALRLAERHYGPESVTTARWLRERGLLLAARGDIAAAIASLDRAASILEPLASSERLEWARVLNDKGSVLYRQGRYPEARDTMAAALAAWENAVGPQDVRLNAPLDTLALAESSLGNTEAAVLHLRRAVSLVEKDGGENDPRLVRLLGELGRTYFVRRELEPAREFLNRARALGEAALGPNHSRVAEVVRRLGQVAFHDGLYDEAAALFRRALEVQEESFGRDSPRLAGTLSDLGAALDESGDLIAAAALYERSITAARRQAGPRSPTVVLPLQNLGSVWMELRDWESARSVLEEALSISETTPGQEAQTAWSKDLLARLAQREGDYERARTLSAEAITLQRRLSPESRDLSLSLVSEGRTLRALGDRLGADVAFREALEIRRRIDHARHAEAGVALAEIATNEIEARRFENARAPAEEALSIFRERIPEHSRVAWALDLLARIDASAGEFKSAETRRREAMAHYARTLGEAHPAWAESALRLAWILARQGHFEESRSLAERGDRVLRASHRARLRGLPERQALGAIAEEPGAASVFLSIAAASGTKQDISRAFGAMIRSRASVMDALIERKRAAREVGASEDPGLRDARQRYSRLLARGPGKQTATYAVQVRSARDEWERLERASARGLSGALSGNEDEGGERLVRRIIDGLPHGVALLSYARVDRTHYATPRFDENLEPRYVAFVAADRGAEPALHDLGPAAEIDRLIAEVRQSVRDIARSGFVAPSTRARDVQALRRLRRLVFDPVRRSVPNHRRFLVVPDGALFGVTFSALPLGERFLVEHGYAFHGLSTERDLLSGVSGSTAASKGALVLADPRANRPPPAVPIAATARGVGVARKALRGVAEACDPQWSPPAGRLAGASRESRAVESVFRRLRVDPVERLTGVEATEDAVKKRGPERKYVHLATHGFFASFDCVSSSPARSAVENPLLLSGLSFAAGGPDADDGILTAEEIAAMDLRGVEWLVLSGCDTAAGRSVPGEGVLGLSRAFRLAGVKTTVMSLWPVDDVSTETWMRSLYAQRFGSRQSTMEAIRRATLGVLVARRSAGRDTHPFFWAGFVATGDWS